MLTKRNPGVYNDLGKKSGDLLGKDFPNNHKAEFKLKGYGGAATFDANVTRNNDGSIYSSLFPKFKFAQQNVTVGAMVDTKRTLKVEATIEDPVPGFKATLTGHGESESVTIDTEYKHDYFTVGSSLNLLSVQGNKFTASGVVGANGFAAGVQSEYVNDKWRNVNGLVSWSSYTKDVILSVFARANTVNPSNIVGLSYYQQINPRFAIAAEASMDVNKTTDVPKITMGGSYAIDTTFDTPVLKGKVDTEGRVSLSYNQQLSRYSRLIIGTSANTNNFAPSGNHTFGLQLVINS